MSIQAASVLDRARFTLLDTGIKGWSNAELVAHFNAGVTQIIALKPEARAKVRLVDLNPGVIQALPDDGVILIDAIMNGNGGTVTVQNLREFANVHPDWATDDEGPTQYVLYDPRVPLSFMVYPQASSGRHIWIKYGGTPTRAVGPNDFVDIDDIYENALWAFVVASAYAKNSTRQNLAKSAQFMTMFVQFVTGTTAAERATAGLQPQPPGAAS